MSGETWENCDPSVSIPILQISGGTDKTLPIDIDDGWGGAPDIATVVDFW